MSYKEREMAIANPEVEFHIEGFIKQCDDMIKEHYELKLPTLDVPKLKLYVGGKYYKVAKRGDVPTTNLFGSSLIKRKAIFGSLPVGRLQLRTSLVEIFLVIMPKM
jgi:hypothetical protein